MSHRHKEKLPPTKQVLAQPMVGMSNRTPRWEAMRRMDFSGIVARLDLVLFSKPEQMTFCEPLIV